MIDAPAPYDPMREAPSATDERSWAIFLLLVALSCALGSVTVALYRRVELLPKATSSGFAPLRWQLVSQRRCGRHIFLLSLARTRRQRYH